jgi:hypothetical protein
MCAAYLANRRDDRTGGRRFEFDRRLYGAPEVRRALLVEAIQTVVGAVRDDAEFAAMVRALLGPLAAGSVVQAPV